MNSGASATLTITPVTGLDANANPYQQTFTVNNVNDPAAMMEIAYNHRYCDGTGYFT